MKAEGAALESFKLSTRNLQLSTLPHLPRHRHFPRRADDRLRLRSSIYIKTPECAWVVDTGTDFRTQVLREDIRRLDAVVFTHSHTDHVMGFDDLRRFSHALG